MQEESHFCGDIFGKLHHFSQLCVLVDLDMKPMWSYTHEAVPVFLVQKLQNPSFTTG